MNTSFKETTCSYLVIGSGLAGLSFALAAPSDNKVIIVTKDAVTTSNSSEAMGGIAAPVGKQDSWQIHCNDTFSGGAFLSDKKAMQDILQSGQNAIRELIKNGCRFDMLKNGNFNLAREGGHSVNRIVRKQDRSGREIISKLLAQCHKRYNIQIRQHFFVKDIITGFYNNQKGCTGITGFDIKENSEVRIKASATILSSGGAGQIYSITSNPEVATGDGYAMASRAGVPLRNMALVQFHPTAHVVPGKKPFLITEAVRGAGAVLRNDKGERFMFQYTSDGELATRDIVSRAIYSEFLKMNSNPSHFKENVRQNDPSKHVWLDLRSIPDIHLAEFTGILEHCREESINPKKEMLPVMPAAHYFCGGIVADTNGKTALHGLYALGEAACTGLHGANRLAGNSLLEAWVTGRLCADAVKNIEKENKNKHNLIDHGSESFNPITFKGSSYRESVDQRFVPVNVQTYFSRKSLQNAMGRFAGVIKSGKGLLKAAEILQEMEKKVYLDKDIPFRREWWENYNLLETAKAVVKDAKNRTENIGVFYNEDFNFSHHPPDLHIS